MLYAKFQEHRTFGSGDVKGFYHLNGHDSWSCDQDTLNKHLSPQWMDASTNLIWL